MKRIAILFACIFALSSCDENQQVIHILKDASELDWLNVTAYSDDIHLVGGASLSPGLMDSVFDYTVHIAKDANRFSIDAGFSSEGTVTGVCVNDGETGLAFDFIGDTSKTILLTAQLTHMDRTEYRLTIERMDLVPVAEDPVISVEPGIAAFFIGSGTIPKIKVDAKLPAAGGVLSYQWYMNTINISVGGYPISGETSDTYTMKRGEVLTVRTVYYYVEITNTIDGRTGVTYSSPVSVTFVNKGELNEKSRAMVHVPAGVVRNNEIASYTWFYEFEDNWRTSGFQMGSCPVTWELWETVFKHAEAGNYTFARVGNQGASIWSVTSGNMRSTNIHPQPVGNELNPVTNIGWREAVVWCNAYSEMDGKDPVYRDSEGNVLRDSRLAVDALVDKDLLKVSFDITKKKGYRLPAAEEWEYAARGAQPGTVSPWTDEYPGTDDESLLDQYCWSRSPGAYAGAAKQTGEVGSLRPVFLSNGEALFDMTGMVWQYVWRPDNDPDAGQHDGRAWFMGADFQYSNPNLTNIYDCDVGAAYFIDRYFQGFRLARDLD